MTSLAIKFVRHPERATRLDSKEQSAREALGVRRTIHFRGDGDILTGASREGCVGRETEPIMAGLKQTPTIQRVTAPRKAGGGLEIRGTKP